jgi:trehalose utilization protein
MNRNYDQANGSGAAHLHSGRMDRIYTYEMHTDCQAKRERKKEREREEGKRDGQEGVVRTLWHLQTTMAI